MLAMPDELAVAIGVSAVVFLFLTFLIVLAVRSVPNKLLLGFPMAITVVLLGACVPETGRLVLALLIPAITLIFAGAICLAIGFVAKLVKSDRKDQPPKPICHRIHKRLRVAAIHILTSNPSEEHQVTLSLPLRFAVSGEIAASGLV